MFAPERVPVAPTVCAVCDHTPLDLEPRCPTCGTQRMSPNVVLASRATEQDAVIARVERVFESRSPESAAKLVAFGERVRQSAAVVNVSVRYAIEFLVSDALLYAAYAKLVEAGARRPAAGVDDTRRRSVESMLFGSYGEEMRYAALTLGGVGLTSYGAVTIVLRDVAVSPRTSLLDENSFTFVERHQLRPGQEVPHGHRCPWATRHLLAMAKCGSQIDETTAEGRFANILCDTTGDRKTDEFIEAFIFGPFGRGAIERLVLPARLPVDVSRSELQLLRRKAASRGVPVEEE